MKPCCAKMRKQISKMFAVVMFFVLLLIELVFLSFKYYYTNWQALNEFDKQVSAMKQVLNSPQYFKNLDNSIDIRIENETYLLWSKQLVIDNKPFVYFIRKDYFSLQDLMTELLYFITIAIMLSWIVYFVVRKSKCSKEFVHNIGHELKTPLAAMYSSLQLAKETWDCNRALNESIWEVKKIKDTIDWLIMLSDITPNKWVSKLNIYDEINDIINEYQKYIKTKHISISIDKKHNLFITTNKEYFNILFHNIISNATKYTNKWWKITIQINKSSIVVSDNGIWISKSNIDKVFDRFFREEHTSKIEWSGIWLSLVKKIADIYEWKIQMESNKWEWTSVTITFGK